MSVSLKQWTPGIGSVRVHLYGNTSRLMSNCIVTHVVDPSSSPPETSPPLLLSLHGGPSALCLPSCALLSNPLFGPPRPPPSRPPPLQASLLPIFASHSEVVLVVEGGGKKTGEGVRARQALPPSSAPNPSSHIPCTLPDAPLIGGDWFW
ncbi:unnamed protein product [Pleuronectes platessa]|uniref:Uncharacterized protein n=1 Tax=Pleuronectes platessa TaxID=8262 RepID=A0A9N7W4N1_PLEPL|nr:unnamed protein product [Pleuronectes platessa]